MKNSQKSFTQKEALRGGKNASEIRMERLGQMRALVFEPPSPPQ